MRIFITCYKCDNFYEIQARTPEVLLSKEQITFYELGIAKCPGCGVASLIETSVKYAHFVEGK